MFPVIAEFGPLTLHTYGLSMSLGFLAGILWTAHLGKEISLPSDTVWSIGLLIMISAVVGAKLLLVIVEMDYYMARPSELFALDTLRSGGVFLGGLAASLAAVVFYFHWRRLPGWQISDCFAPGLALGHAIGRLGCFAAGCCYGAECRLPWAVTFTNPRAHEIVGVPLNIPMHPTQLYEFLAEAAIFCGLVWLWNRRRFDGQVILTYLLAYSTVRFGLDFFRGENFGMLFSNTISSSQLLCLLTLPIAFLLYQRRRRRPAPAVASGKAARGAR